MQFHPTKAYKYRPILDTTLVARIIGQTGEMFKQLHKIKEIEIALEKEEDKEKYASALKSSMVLALKNLKGIAIDSETIMYREAMEINEIDKRLKKVKLGLEETRSAHEEHEAIQKQKETFDEYIKEFEGMKYAIREIMKKLAESVESLVSGRLSHIMIREISLRSDQRIIKLMKRRGIEIFHELKQIDELSKNLTFGNLRSLEHKFHHEFENLEVIIEFAFIIVSRFKHILSSIKTDDEKVKREIEHTKRYLHETLHLIDKNIRYGLHEINALAA